VPTLRRSTDRSTTYPGDRPEADGHRTMNIPPDHYPAELSCTAEGRDGAIVHLRPIRSDDGDRLTEFHEGLSTQSVYRRFFFVHPKLSAVEIEKFTHVDYRDRLALVATDDDRLIAVGRYERIPGTQEAEVAFVVADEFQHRGIATLLLEHLAAAALDHGITTFAAETLAENRDMIDVFMKSGFHVTANYQYGTMTVRFPIEPDEGYRATCAARHHKLEDAPLEDGRLEDGAQG
jgi:GNAT superfamily N-acetyltransferase